MNDQEKEEEIIKWEKELNREVLDLIYRLYDETFKDLVHR